MKIDAIFVIKLTKMEVFRIKEILDQKGWKAKELADKLGTTPQYVSGIIRGEASISFPRLQEIADILGVTIPELFSDYKATVTVEPGMLICPHCGNMIKVIVEK